MQERCFEEELSLSRATNTVSVDGQGITKPQNEDDDDQTPPTHGMAALSDYAATPRAAHLLRKARLTGLVL
jgi:hypothetical protein